MDEEELRRIADDTVEMLTAMAYDWELTPAEKAALTPGLAWWLCTGDRTMSRAQINRSAAIIAVHAALMDARLTTQGASRDWLRWPCAELDGRVPLDVMIACGISGMKRVRQALKAQRRDRPRSSNPYLW